MNFKEKIIFAFAALIVCACFFFIGAKYENVRTNQLHYQIKIKASFEYPVVKDSIHIYDGKRYVGTVALEYGQPFADLILSDNE